ncbi:hypothetical protein Golax_022232, partial [Gossypium laxum]|nr:hypothetical protein [Gossypium laxum]
MKLKRKRVEPVNRKGNSEMLKREKTFY